jgi:hypothetical protein
MDNDHNVSYDDNMILDICNIPNNRNMSVFHNNGIHHTYDYCHDNHGHMLAKQLQLMLNQSINLSSIS